MFPASPDFQVPPFANRQLADPAGPCASSISLFGILENPPTEPLYRPRPRPQSRRCRRSGPKDRPASASTAVRGILSSNALCPHALTLSSTLCDVVAGENLII